MCLNLGLSKSTLSDMKSGRKKGVSTLTAQKIANYLYVSVGYLLGGEEEKKNDAIADIILKLRTDDTFVNVVSTIKDLSPEQLLAVQTFLSAFQK